ncbi:MAG: SDR family NAD(P)-dependent oxidoreductase [Tannerella sp.]|jgi:NADP-dependent 3-hydroxy acid dehydrogenase YdfG|nr:SDR family NAD(P)-dependent oxidoreductase [Tannerella sp.]
METIFITGATSGIGKACAELLAKQGKRLIICGRRKEILEELKQKLSQCVEVYTLSFDVRNQQDVHKSIASLPENWKNIDVLINSAGNAHGLDKLDEGKIADWDAMIDGNVKGLLYVSQPIIRTMKMRRKGHIINLSSIAGRETYAGGTVYCVSKHAVEAISKGMRLELTEFGIKVTNVQPGAAETAFSLVRFKGDTERADKVYEGYKPLTAEDIADAIAYCINAPEHVTIADICIMPSAQASTTVTYRHM